LRIIERGEKGENERGEGNQIKDGRKGKES